MSMQEPNLGGQPQSPAPAPAPAPQQPQQQPTGDNNATPPPTATPTPAPQAQPQQQPQPQQEMVHTGLPPVQVTENQQLVDGYLAQAGLTSDHISAELEHSGKISDVTRQLLVAKHGDNAALVEQVIMANHQQQTILDSQAETAAHGFVAEQFGLDAEKGGQALSELISWGVANISAERMNQYADLIDAGGLQGELALKSMIDEFKAKSNVAPNPINGDAPNMGGGAPMTREEYNKQRFEIEEKYGYNSPQMVDLQNKRNAAIAAGY